MSKTLTKEEMSLNAHVEDLRERMRMLQNDRTANVDVLEANKAANKEEIKRLRGDNKEFRQKLAQLQRTTANDSSKDELKHVEREVEALRRTHDDLVLKSKRQREALEGLRDAVKDLELDSQRPHMEDNEYTRNIRSLENKLDKAMIKYNEAQSIRKTYEQIVRRLKEERVGFDNQLAAIERTLAAKLRDYEELLLLAGDANHARETALGELDRVRAGYEEERRRRERDLRERHQVVQLRRQMLERMKHREKMRMQLEGEEKAAEDSATTAMNAQTQKMVADQRIETRNKIDVFENAFRKIKEATGVSDVNEVIQKIVSQESTTENLIALTRENQGKIEALSELRRKVKLQFEEVKYSSAGGGHRRKMVDDHEDQLANSGARLERSRLKYERLCKLITAMKAGIGHLQDKLEVVREEMGGKRHDMGDETVAEVLREAELCLNNVRKRAEITGTQPNLADTTETKLSDDEDGFQPDEGGPDLDDEELTRDKIKRASTQILQAVDRRKRRTAASAAKKAAGSGSPDKDRAHD
eukprot:GSChrysophyteH1.ASY1.ANO1.5.1 assembled CDS